MAENRELFPFEDIYSPMLSPLETQLPSSLSTALSDPPRVALALPPPPTEPADKCDHAPLEEEMDCCDEAATTATTAEDALRRGPPLSDTPGGDCTRLCVRHQRMANGGTNIVLQKVIPLYCRHSPPQLTHPPR